MKKFILIGFIGLALVGCDEKKVTEEMLNGDWECTVTQQIARWKNGLFQDYDKPKSEKILVSYKTYNGVIIKNRPNDVFKDNWESNSTYRALYDIKDVNAIGKNVNLIESKMEYISNNEYKLTGIFEVIKGNETEAEQMKDNFKNKFEENCIKIK